MRSDYDVRCRMLSLAAALTLGMGAAARAQVRDLPSGQRIEVARSTAERLSKTLPFGASTSAELGDDTERLLIGLLPESSRKSCGDLVETWGARAQRGGSDGAIIACASRSRNVQRSGGVPMRVPPDTAL